MPFVIKAFVFLPHLWVAFAISAIYFGDCLGISLLPFLGIAVTLLSISLGPFPSALRMALFVLPILSLLAFTTEGLSSVWLLLVPVEIFKGLVDIAIATELSFRHI
jgi:hypothetical protein